MFKFLIMVSTTALVVSFAAMAQNTNTLPPAETAPLLKMAKPELKIVFIKQPANTTEDEVVAEGEKSKLDVKVNDPIICKDLIAPGFGKFSTGSRIKKTKKYCNHRSKWNIREREAQKLVKDFADSGI